MQNSHSINNGSLGFPTLVDPEEQPLDTWPMPLHDLPLNHQIEVALGVVGARHPHIVKAVRAFWGFPEGEDYLKKLIFDGMDPKSHTREGFRPDVLSALLSLQAIHTVTMR